MNGYKRNGWCLKSYSKLDQGGYINDKLLFEFSKKKIYILESTGIVNLLLFASIQREQVAIRILLLSVILDLSIITYILKKKRKEMEKDSYLYTYLYYQHFF